MVETNVDVTNFDSAAANVRPFVIIADHDPENIHRDKKTLKDNGFDDANILTASTGIEALDLWHENKDKVGVIIQRRVINWGRDENDIVNKDGLNGMEVIDAIYEGNDVPPTAFLQTIDKGDPTPLNWASKLNVDVVNMGDIAWYMDKIKDSVGGVSPSIPKPAPNEGADYGDAVMGLSAERLDNNVS